MRNFSPRKIAESLPGLLHNPNGRLRRLSPGAAGPLDHLSQVVVFDVPTLVQHTKTHHQWMKLRNTKHLSGWWFFALPLGKIMDFVSWDDFSIPNIYIYRYIETYKNPWFQSPPLAAMTAPWPQLGPGEPGFKDRLAEAPP